MGLGNGRRTCRRLGAAVVALLALAAALSATGCSDPVAARGGITATSGAPQGGGAAHSHQVTVPLADIEDPPPDGRTYVTSTAGAPAHDHTVRLTAAQLTALRQDGAVVNVVTSTVQDHFHVFVLER